MVEDVARRLRRLEDRAAIHDLVARYALAVDDHDYAALQGMYAADAVFRHAEGGRPPGSRPSQGREGQCGRGTSGQCRVPP